jgi:hypothetical protein
MLKSNSHFTFLRPFKHTVDHRLTNYVTIENKQEFQYNKQNRTLTPIFEIVRNVLYNRLQPSTKRSFRHRQHAFGERDRR